MFSLFCQTQPAIEIFQRPEELCTSLAAFLKGTARIKTRVNLAWAIYCLGIISTEGEKIIEKKPASEHQPLPLYLNLNMQDFYALCEKWFNKREMGSADRELLLLRLRKGIDIIKAEYDMPESKEQSIFQALPETSGRDLEKFCSQALWNEHLLAYLWGYILIGTYTIGSGVMAAGPLVMILLAIHVPAAWLIVASVLIFLLTLPLAWKTSELIPAWLATCNSWWKTFIDLSPEKKSLLIASFVAVLGGGITYGALTYSFTAPFLGLLGISPFLCSALAVPLLIGLTFATAIILLKGCWDLIEQGIWKTVCEHFAEIFKGHSAWGKAFIFIGTMVFFLLIGIGLVATSDEGLSAVWKVLHLFPWMASRACDVLGKVIVFAGIIGQLPFVIDTLLRGVNFFLEKIKGIGEKAHNRLETAMIWVFIGFAALGDGIIAALGVLDDVKTWGKILIWMWAPLAAVGQFVGSVTQAFINDAFYGDVKPKIASCGDDLCAKKDGGKTRREEQRKTESDSVTKPVCEGDDFKFDLNLCPVPN